MSNIVRLKRKVRPLKATYDPSAPYIVAKLDNDDEENTISYEVTDTRPDTYRILCFVHEDTEERGQAKLDAELIAKALNFHHHISKLAIGTPHKLKAFCVPGPTIDHKNLPFGDKP